MSLFLTIAFLFFIGSMAGWVIEVVFRRFFSSANPERKWINPGFLSGPYLPLYGFSLCVLFLLSLLEQYIPIENTALRKAALLVKIKRFADEKQIVVKYEQLREHIRVNREKRLEKAKFLMSMGPQSAMAEQLKQYYDKFRDELERSKKDARKTDGGDEK